MRKGDWKLVCKFPGDWELYNIVENRTETDNVADSHPDIVEELSALHDAWAERCDVKPWAHMQEIMAEKAARRRKER